MAQDRRVFRIWVQDFSLWTQPFGLRAECAGGLGFGVEANASVLWYQCFGHRIKGLRFSGGGFALQIVACAIPDRTSRNTFTMPTPFGPSARTACTPML